MNDSRRQTLFSGIGHHDVHRLVLALEPYPVDFHRVPWKERLVAAITEHRFDLIFVGYPTIGMPLDDLVTVLRDPASASRAAGLVVLATPRSLAGARRFLGRGVNRVLSSIESTEGLLDAAVPLLQVARRVRLRAPIDLTVPDSGCWTPARCHTEDLSRTGMLVRCNDPAPAGATVDFSLALPGDAAPIRGRAQVARQTDPSREAILGLGARFLSFSGNDRERLDSMLWGNRGTRLDDRAEER